MDEVQISTAASTAQQGERLADDVGSQLLTLSLHDGDEENRVSQTPKKDPRRIARKYQLDICTKALEENIVLYMGTGCGKTHIAILLIYEMGHLIRKPQKNICIFLAPSVALVQQQAKVIEASVDFKVGTYCGGSRKKWSHNDRDKEIAEYEVLVMTPDILLHFLSHCFVKIELIALLIFDECHYAQLESNHPYAEIMKIFYKRDLAQLPRIFGMTASPILGKGGSVDGVEALLRAKVYSIEDEGEFEQFVTSPKVNIYHYDSIKNGHACPFVISTRKLEEIKLQVDSSNGKGLGNTLKLLRKLHSDITFCLENLGQWGALLASYMYLKGKNDEIAELDGEESCSDSTCKKYLHEVSLFLDSECNRDGVQADLSSVEALKEPFFSRKLLKLVEILFNFRLKPNMKCIIFVNRIITARLLSNVLQNLIFLSSWKCDYLVGIHSGLLSRKSTNIILEKFRSGELNLLVATKVGEEGLDIQTCGLVIRFDLPETLASFIQSRGRARMPQSEYVFLVDRGNPRELNLVEDFKRNEDLMNEEISSRKSAVQMMDFNDRTYKVDITGATISSVSSVSLLHHYCSKLPHDEYFNPKPEFYYCDDTEGMVCHTILPANAPVHEIISASQPSKEAAKRDACLKACQALHEVGALTDYLLPEHDENHEESTHDLFDCDGRDDDELREELHEMLVPAALKKPWTDLGNSTCFNSYYIKINPDPADRVYRQFGFFVKDPLPEEAEKMKLDLFLDRGRMVRTELIPSGITSFDKDEIALAEKFQRMFLKIIHDRHEFISEYVSLEDNGPRESASLTFYLLLPVIEHESEKLFVEWTIVKRCLSSPIFRCPGIGLSNETSILKNPLCLANGCSNLHDVLNSLVYVPSKGTFFFIADVLPEKNGYSSYNDSRNHVEHYAELFDIHLAYPAQPLLKAKQLFVLDNLLRKKKKPGILREKVEYFVELPPEICQLKIIGFSKDIGSSLSLLPSIMHRLESFLVAIELKEKLIASFPEAAEVTVTRILEALTTERCSEQFSLERLEVLGDAFLKFAVGRHLFLKHGTLDEGQLTKKRSDIISNHNLLKLAKRSNLQAYIRDQSLEPNQFFPFGRPCPLTCNKEMEKIIHSRSDKKDVNIKVRCSKCHHWLHKKTIADAVEALIGAFIVDSGFKAATAFLNWLGIQIDFSPAQVECICSASEAFLPLADRMDVNALENILGYKFANKGLLIQAFVHPSFNYHLGGCYQRLEFLGDAVLDYLITSYLYSAYPNLKPGYLTDLRSSSVNNVSFADVARRWSFHKFVICDSRDLCESITKYVNDIGNSSSLGGYIEEKTCPKVLGDLVESCMGALFIDTGFDLSCIWKIMLFLLDPIASSSRLQINPCRELTELCQYYKWGLEVSTLKKDGKFLVEATVNGETASASNISGKAARRIVARQLFERLKSQGYKSKLKSLKEVLHESVKMEAKLIGYDEAQLSAKSVGLKLQEISQSGHSAGGSLSSNRYTLSGQIRESPSPHQAPECSFTETNQDYGCYIDIPAVHLYNVRIADPQGTAKSSLCELCAANFWKPPVFDCYKEMGPDHLKEFIFKVLVEIEERPNEVFEFYGGPQPTKKLAAEHAAEGALWYFNHEGYTSD